MNIKKSILLRVRLAFLAVVVFVLAVVYRMIDVQYVDGEQWRQKAEEIGLDYKTIKATRGSIYASGNDLLATSLPFYQVAMDPSVASDEVFTSDHLDSLSHLISSFYRDHDSEFYRKKISEARVNKRKYILINKRLVNYNQKQMMESWPIFREGQYGGGVIFQKRDRRHNPFKSLAKRTIGYLREDIGVGIEYSFNDYLAGRDGEGLYQKMAGGNWKPVNAASDIKPIDGYDVHTTIDINLQDVAQNALLRALEKHKANYGTVVLMEVQTGEIKAITNLTRQTGGGYAETYNYAVQGLNDPGSTFKLASMIALLEQDEVEISLTDTVDTGNGVKEFYNKKMRDEGYWKGGYGKLTVQEVFEKSSNVGVSMLIDSIFGDNPQAFVDAVKKTGYGELLDFQMMGEGVPYVKNTDDDSWSGLSLPWMSVGYETSVTPLQTLALYNAVANDGKMIQPIIIKSINRANESVKKFETKRLQKRIASKETLRKLRAMLEGVVERGTAKNIKNSHYKIAGKTGTAQKLINGRYTSQRYYTSFAGYFPADEPMYSAIVVIDDPEGWNSYASGVAAPVFKEIADMIYSQDLEIHKEFQAELAAEPGTFPMIRAGYYDELKLLCDELGISNHLEETDVEWVRTKVDNNAIMWRRNHTASDLVPNVKGMTLRDALYLLENKGLKVSITGTGRVRKQSVRPGMRIGKGTTITIELG